jgi:hypothetical protein
VTALAAVARAQRDLNAEEIKRDGAVLTAWQAGASRRQIALALRRGGYERAHRVTVDRLRDRAMARRSALRAVLAPLFDVPASRGVH